MAALGQPVGRGAATLCPHDGGVRRVPRAHGPPYRPAARFPRRDRRAGQHADHGHHATTAPAPRAARPARSTRTSSSTSSKTTWSRTSRPSTTSAARSTSTTTRGAGPGPATRPSDAGSARPTEAASATPSSSTGRRASRPRARSATQYGHAIDMVPTVLDAARRRAADVHRRCPTVADRGRQHERIRSPTRKRRHCATTQYFEMLGHRSIYHDGWRAVCPWPGPSFAEGRPFGTPIPAEMLTELDATGWELYHVAEDWSESHDVAGEHRDKLIEMIAHVVRRGRQVQRAAGRRPGPAALRRGAPGHHVRSLSATSTTRAPRRCRPTRRPSCSTGPTAHTCGVVESPTRAPKGVLSQPGRCRRRVLVVRAGRQAALHLQLRGRPALPHRLGLGRPQRASTSSASSSPRPAHPSRSRARAHPAPSPSSSMAQPVGSGELPVTMPTHRGPGRRSVGGPRCRGTRHARYQPPFAFTGTVHPRRVRRLGRPRSWTTRPRSASPSPASSAGPLALRRGRCRPSSAGPGPRRHVPHCAPIKRPWRSSACTWIPPYRRESPAWSAAS